MKQASPRPPVFFIRFFKWFCKPELHPYLEGDLLEHFEDKVLQKGERKAQRHFAKDVLKLFRPGIIRPLISTQKLNQHTMLGHNIKIARRNFTRHISSFLINLLGLSSGLMVVLFIYLWVNDELSMDKFHKQDSQLYQVLLTFDSPNGRNTIPWTPAPLAKGLKAEIPELAQTITVTADRKNGVVSFDGQKKIRANEIYAGENFFEMFTFPLLHGNKALVLKSDLSVAISEQLALKLFNTTENLIGKVIQLDKEKIAGNYQISGVFQNPPSNSTLQFDAVFSMDRLVKFNEYMNNWAFNDPDTYVLLQKGVDPSEINQKVLAAFRNKPNVEVAATVLRKFSNSYLYGTYKDGVQAGGRITYVRLFSIIAAIILLIACINFMNLSTAQASRRLKEVGVKKAIGIKRRGLIVQFLTESLLLSFLALAIAVLAVYLLMPGFSQLIGKTLTFLINTESMFALLGIALVTGLIAGSYPALYLSGFQTVTLLKAKLNAKTNDLWIRKGLVVFQFSVSIVLIASILVVYQQIGLIQNKNLGYVRDNVIVFPVEGEVAQNTSAFLTKVENIPGVVSASGSDHDIMVNGSGTRGVSWEGKDPELQVTFKYINANYHFVEALGMELAAGRAFSREFATDDQKVVLNETAVKVMELENPVGQIITIWGQNREVIGVVKDFHFESFYEEVKPLFYKVSEENNDIYIRIQAGTEMQTIDRIRDFYQEYNEGLVFDFSFLDSRYQQLYQSENRIGLLSKYFAGIAMVISCLGLLGLATFSAERRVKEIGIRKALGASVSAVIGMLTADFAKMVVIAIIIALPFSYWLTNDWLNQFAYHIELKWWFFALTGLATLIIALLTIGYRTLIAASAKPTDCLRYE